MSVFTKFREIVDANIDSILAGSGNPRRTLRLMIQDMEDTLVEMKVYCAQEMADRAQAARSCGQIGTELDRWDERAALALSKGREDMAREALFRKKAVREDIARMTEEIRESDEKIRICQGEIKQVDARLQDARKRLDRLDAPQTAATRDNGRGYSVITPKSQQGADPEVEAELERLRKIISENKSDSNK